MWGDFKYAARMLVKSPAFSLVAIITLALGIGANTAIFSVVEGTLLRPLPFANANRLVRLYEATDDNGARGSTLNLSEQTFRQWREFGGDIFEGVASATGTNVPSAQSAITQRVALPPPAPAQTSSRSSDCLRRSVALSLQRKTLRAGRTS
jgi:hypothetical protein